MLFGLDFFGYPLFQVEISVSVDSLGQRFLQVEASVRKNRERHKKAVAFPVAILTGDGSDRV